MVIINYKFISPKLLEKYLCKILIKYNINFCSIKDDKYSEIHFDNYIIRIYYDEMVTFFNNSEFLSIVGIINQKEKTIKKAKLNSEMQGVCAALFDFDDDMRKFELNTNVNKYKDINYMSKKKQLRNNNKSMKANTRRK